MEIWKAVPGWPWYEASNSGHVRSLDRTIQQTDGRRRAYKGQILKGYVGNHGYFTIKLCAENGQHAVVCVHHIIALVFIGPRPKYRGCEIRHKDGCKLNNREDNLEYNTSSRNTQDVKHHGGRVDSAVTVEQVREIKRALQTPYHGIGRYLARKYGVGDSVISYIRHGKFHADVQP